MKTFLREVALDLGILEFPQKRNIHIICIIYTHIYVCLIIYYMYVCMYIYMYVCICVCVCMVLVVKNLPASAGV